jgi:hypothetical protein
VTVTGERLELLEEGAKEGDETTGERDGWRVAATGETVGTATRLLVGDCVIIPLLLVGGKLEATGLFVGGRFVGAIVVVIGLAVGELGFVGVEVVVIGLNVGDPTGCRTGIGNWKAFPANRYINASVRKRFIYSWESN